MGRCRWCLQSLCLVLELADAQALPEAGEWQRAMEAGHAAVAKGQLVEAERLFAAAMRMCENRPADLGRLARSVLQMGVLRETQGRCDEAVSLLLRGIGMLEQHAEAAPAAVSEAWQALGTAYFCQRRYAQSQRAYLKALELSGPSARRDTSREIVLLSALGTAYRYGGSLRQAEETFARGQELLERDPSAAAPIAVFFLNNLAAIRRMAGRYAEAEAALFKAVDVLARGNDPDGVASAYVWGSLGLLHSTRRQYAQAVEPFRKSAALIAAGVPVWRGDAEVILQGYAHCLQKLGDRAGAGKVKAAAAEMLSSMPREQTGGMTLDIREPGVSK